MDHYHGRRGAHGILTPRKKNSALKEVAADEDHSAQFCNRVGCNGRIKYNQNAKNGCSSDGKEVARKSPRKGSSAITYAKKSNVDFEGKLLSQSKFEQGNDKPSLLDHPRRRSKSSMNKSKGMGIDRPVVSSNVRPQTTLHHKSTLQHQSSSPASAVSSGSKTSSQVLSGSQNVDRCSARNVKCYSVSDAASASSSRESKSVGRMMKKKTSSLREKSGLCYRVGKATKSSSSGEYSRANSSVLTRRPKDMNTGQRLSSQQNERNNFSVRESVVDFYEIQNFSRRDRNFSSSSSDTPEVLPDLERIELDEELTDEEAFLLEAVLDHNGAYLFDQHRDMRLDIDNMSYEDLLALEERMGTVSTALSKEALSSCLKKSIFKETQPEGLSDNRNDSKCSICQEEYAAGDEIAELVECWHEYHLTCINQWLQLKNWCPICKSSVASSLSSSTS